MLVQHAKQPLQELQERKALNKVISLIDPSLVAECVGLEVSREIALTLVTVVRSETA